METSSFTPKTDDESSFNEILILETVSGVTGVVETNNQVEIPVIFSIDNVFSKLKGLGPQDFEGEQFKRFANLFNGKTVQGLGLKDFEGEQFDGIKNLLNRKADDVDADSPEADSPEEDDRLCDDHDGTHWNMCDSLNDWMLSAFRVLMGAMFVVLSFFCLQSVYWIVMNETPQEIGKFMNTMTTNLTFDNTKLTEIDEFTRDNESSENDSNEDDNIINSIDNIMTSSKRMMTGALGMMTEGVAPDSSDAISDKIDLSSSSDPNDSLNTFSDTSMSPNIPFFRYFNESKELKDMLSNISNIGYDVLGHQLLGPFKLANEPNSEITEIAKPSEIAFGAMWDSLKPLVYKKFIDLI